MSKYYSCHPKFWFDACFKVLRSQVKELINWALRSDNGGSYDDDHSEDYHYPMRKIRQLQPDDKHYGNRIREQGPDAFKRRTDLLNRLTGTPHEDEPD